jgi:Zn-dependent protease
MNSTDFPTMLKLLPGVIAGLTFHEFMHGYVAFRCGDPTASESGRLSLNPLRHIDWLGFLFIVIAGFGWAKPVMINRSLLRHPRRDEIAIALAGPGANFVLALLLSLLLQAVLPFTPSGGPVFVAFLQVLVYGIYVNLGLGVFNLLPIPPLDGSHVFFQSLRLSETTTASLHRYGIYVLFAILLLESQAHITILPVGAVVRWMADTVFSLLGISF